MALESFYGGKPGISPVIRNSFKFISTSDPAYNDKLNQTFNMSDLSLKEQAILKTIDKNLKIESVNVAWTNALLKPFTMDECFKDPEYKDVWYNELCIIDTESKSNPNNGKLFRRTLKRIESALDSEGTSYAEYIGQIVGPSGGIPNLQLGSIDSVRNQAAGITPTLETDSTNMDTTNWDFFYPKEKNDNIIGSSDPLENHPEKIAELSVSKDNTINMVPGYELVNDEPRYNDEIKYTWCNVHRKTETEEKSFWLYLGFDIPYPVFDFSAQLENYTYNTTDTTNNLILLEETDLSKEHPFFNQYKFHIPRGTRGIGLEEVFRAKKIIEDEEPKIMIIVNPSTENETEEVITLYSQNNIIYNNSEDMYYISDPDEIFIPEENSFWVGKWTLYNPRTGDTPPTTVYLYMGAYRDINNIALDSVTNDIYIKYSDTDESSFLYNPKIIKSIDYANEEGTLNFHYSAHDNNYDFDGPAPEEIYEVGPIHQLDKAKIKEDGYLYLYYADERKYDENGNRLPDEWTTEHQVGLVIHNPTIVSTVSISHTSINELINTLNDENNPSYEFEYTSPNNIKTVLNVQGIHGEIEIDDIQKTGNFICVKIDKGNNEEEENYIIYYDPSQQQWINGGLLNGGGDSQNSNFTIQYYDDNNSSLFSPKEEDYNIKFTFLSQEFTSDLDATHIPLSNILWL